MSALEALGIDDTAEGVYGSLLDRPGMSLSEVASAAGLNRRQADEALRGLEDLGLASRSPTKPARYLPAAPETALEVLVLRRQEALQSARNHAAQLQRRFIHGSEGAANPLELIEVVTGEPAVVQRYRQLRSIAQREVLSFDRPPYTTELEAGASLTIDDLRRKVAFRTVYDPSALELPGRLDQVKQTVEAGEGARIGTVPMKLAIADDRIAILPLRVDFKASGAALEGAIVVHPSPLLEALTRLFDLVWQSATAPDFLGQPTHAGRQPLDQIDRDILLLLLGGAKDESIANSLKLADRTVGRRISLLMSYVNAQSRFQLGVLAVKSGWLT